MPSDEEQRRQDFFADALLQDLAQDEPEDSIIRQVAERRGLVRPLASALPDWCVVNAWIRQRGPLGWLFQVIEVRHDFIRLRSEADDDASVSYRHEPTALIERRFEPSGPPLRGLGQNSFMIDYQAHFPLDPPYSLNNAARVTIYNEDMQPIMTSETLPTRFDSDVREVIDGSGYARVAQKRVEADAKPAPTRFDREDPV